MAAAIMTCGLIFAARPTTSTLIPKNAVRKRSPTPDAAAIAGHHLLAPEDRWRHCSGGYVPSGASPRMWRARPRYHTRGPDVRVDPRKVSRAALLPSGEVLVKRITRFLTLALPD